VAEALPRDDSGYQVTPRDCEFLGLDPQQVRDWSRRDAPLGMTPEQYDDFRGEIFDGLQQDGADEDDVDARLQGSSARFFAGPHKDFPHRDDLPDDAGRANFDAWRGGTDENPARRPFDSMYRLGVDAPSDYDLQLSSDALVDRCRAERDRFYPDRPLFNDRYGFVDRDIVTTALPNLQQACERQSDVLGRAVNPAVFGSDGPPERPSGPSSHFRDDDWTLHRRRHR
jgi:hypothetical protein